MNDLRTIAGAFLLTILGVTMLVVPAWAEEPTVADAIAAFRDVQLDKLSDQEMKAKDAELNKAWQRLAGGGDVAAKALKQELAAIRKAGRRDDFFALVAAGLLWKIHGVQEAAEIAGIWQSADLTKNYDDVFRTAYEAARTRDARVLPMLGAQLHEKRGKHFVAQHYLSLTWPLNQNFVWGVYGRGALPYLESVLTRSQDPVELQTAMLLLASAQQLSALPSIRQLAKSDNPEVRGIAIECLGYFGHPQDYDLLVRNADRWSEKEIASRANALCRYGDLRAVPLLTRYLKSHGPKIRRTTLYALMAMPCPESLEAIRRHAETTIDLKEKRGFQDAVAQLLKLIGATQATYENLSASAKEKLFDTARQKRERRFDLDPRERRLTRAEFAEAAAEWKKNRRITGGKFEWVEEHHVLAVATPADIPLLLDVRAAVYERLSDEALYEIKTLEQLIGRLGRSRYRQTVGATKKVEPVE